MQTRLSIASSVTNKSYSCQGDEFYGYYHTLDYGSGGWTMGNFGGIICVNEQK
jgi:hypothetical protein